jgi:hypothetical protein
MLIRATHRYVHRPAARSKSRPFCAGATIDHLYQQIIAAYPVNLSRYSGLSPEFSAAILYCVKTINDSSSIAPMKVERTENVKPAAASSPDKAKRFVGEGALRLA